MAESIHLYRKGGLAVFNKQIDWNSDTLKATLHTSSYTPDYDAHDYQDDLTNELSTGGGYTEGGATLADCTATLTAANSWATTWVANTAYAVGALIRPTTGNAHLYRCIVAGTSHADTEPTWTTVSGQVNTDGTVTWAECGGGVIVFDCTDIAWSSATFTARYCVIADTTPGSAGTNPLILCVDFGADKSPSNGTFQITVNANGLFYMPIP